jgi:hypothetical protein
MAKKDKVRELRQKSHAAAMEGLRKNLSFPVPPRKAMSRSKKASKKLSYPVSPYPDANILQLFRWGRYEWSRLGRWQSLAGPVIALVALTTWEKEKALQDARSFQIEKVETKQMAARIYGAFGRKPRKRRKLLGLVPLPGGK